MARTALLRRFQALFADFEEAERSGRSPQEVREQRRQMGLTRRDFLKVTGATVGAAALGGPVAALASGGKPGGTQGRIAIIGGGISGLNAALTLQDAGIASTVYGLGSRRRANALGYDLMAVRPDQRALRGADRQRS
jgi:monoamine oxidase